MIDDAHTIENEAARRQAVDAAVAGSVKVNIAVQQGEAYADVLIAAGVDPNEAASAAVNYTIERLLDIEDAARNDSVVNASVPEARAIKASLSRFSTGQGWSLTPPAPNTATDPYLYERAAEQALIDAATYLDENGREALRQNPLYGPIINILESTGVLSTSDNGRDDDWTPPGPHAELGGPNGAPPLDDEPTSSDPDGPNEPEGPNPSDTASVLATIGAAAIGEVDSVERPSWRQSEIDQTERLGEGARSQVSYKDGVEVDHGTPGSVRPDNCIDGICSIEVKNYNVTTNERGLIRDVSRQAIQRNQHLPDELEQRITIDIRGQYVTDSTQQYIREKIAERSQGIIKPDNIEFFGGS